MAPFRYMMISTVACEAGYLDEASGHLTGVMGELASALPDVSAYFGSFHAGRNAGSLALVHLYRDLADVDPAFGVYGASPHFAAAAGSGKIALRERNLTRLMEAEQRGSDPIAPVQLLLRHTAPGLDAASRARLADAAMGAGASQFRCGTVWTGTIAGSGIVTLGCPTPDVADTVEAACREALPGAMPERDLLCVTG